MNLDPPQKQIYDAVFKAALDLGYDTFDYLPAEKVNYPFIFIGEQFDQDRKTKRFLYGDVQQTIHVYHSYKKRRELMQIVGDLKVSLRNLKKTTNFDLVCKNVTGQTLNDPKEPLLHAIIETEFTFY